GPQPRDGLWRALLGRGRPRILLLPGHQNETRSVQRERRAVEPAVELDAAPALGAQHRRQLVRRVEPDLALADQLLRALLALGRRAPKPEPLGLPAAGRRSERFLEAERPAVHALALLRWQRAHELVPVARVQDEHAARLEGAPEAVHHQAVLVVGEVPDRAEEVHGQIELAREFHVTDVLAHQREAPARLAGGLAGALELGLAEVDAGH